MNLSGKFFRGCVLLVALVCSFGCASSAGAVCFVNGAATGKNDGTSWVNAFTNPQFALLKTDCREIWVAKGVYKPTLGKDPSVYFQVRSGVELYGGFLGSEVTRDARMPATNVTILSGDVDDDDANAKTTGIDGTAGDIHGTNSYHVLFLNGGAGSTPITASTIVDGFTITGGAASSNGINADGGGLYCYGHGNGRADLGAECSPVLRNLVFSGNSAANDGARSTTTRRSME